MPLRRTLGLTAAAAVAVLGLPAPAIAAEAPTTLYVMASRSQCSETGPGTPDRPFCSISAAAKIVEPGQTIHVDRFVRNTESVRVTRSGTPDKPIVIEGDDPTLRWMDSDRTSIVPGANSSDVFTLTGVHDVVIRNFSFYDYDRAVAVTNSSNIVVERNDFRGLGDSTASVQISGDSRQVTVGRNRFQGSSGVVVAPGARDTVVSTNAFHRSTRGAVSATGAAGLAVTSNTVVAPCGPGVAVAGASTGVSVRNNILAAVDSADAGSGGCAEGAPARGGVQLSVAAESAPGTVADYNTVHPSPGGAAYSWAGTEYPSPAAFTAATRQGAQDLDLLPVYLRTEDYELTEANTAAFDNADPDAPGLLPTDLLGQAAVDNPNVPNGGPRGTFRDRGAYERTGLRKVTLDVIGTAYPVMQGPTPFSVKAVATVTNQWPTKLSYSFDFGDGTPPVVTTEPTATHVYERAGEFLPVVTAIDEVGAARPSPPRQNPLSVRPAGPLTVDFTLRPLGGILTYTFDQQLTSPWRIVDRRVDWGDGTLDSETRHSYRRPGRYTVTMTATDVGGRTSSAARTLDVDYTPDVKLRMSGERVQLVYGNGVDFLMTPGVNYTQKVWDQISETLPSRYGSLPPVATAYTANDQVHALKVEGGRIYIADRRLVESNWVYWYDIEAAGAAGPLGTVTDVAATAIGNQLHVVAVADGRLYEAVADFDKGRWSRWGDITGALGLGTGIKQVAASTLGNALHLAALGTDGHIYAADGNYDRGTWWADDITRLFGAPGTVTQLAAATTGSRFHVLALSGGSVHQITADYAVGRWSAWANVSSVIGLGGSIQQLAAASTGNTLRLYGLSGGIVHDAAGDYNVGRWSGWNSTGAYARVLAAAGTG
ncbi:PKD domain-containing protein [Kitasatospora sp. NPDC088351]|uniref:PKD domain-containing protein n=1 Tax=Kitasatospora sp. NPDC088351 TaxID=3155180 RepID=UPI00341CEC81